MIVTEKQAEEALIVLGTYAGYAPGNGLAQLDSESLKALARDAAKRAHPDAGGTSEDFVAVDRAKHILLRWLERQAQTKPKEAAHGEQCQQCGGTGSVQSRRGFKAMRVQCHPCRGTGYAGVEHDEGEQY